MLFGRRKPGFTKAMDPAVEENFIAEGKSSSIDFPDSLPESNVAEAANTTPASEATAAESTEKPDLFDYMASQPDVYDPYPEMKTEEPTEEEPAEEPEAPMHQQLADYIRIRSSAAQITPKATLASEIEGVEDLLAQIEADESCKDIAFKDGAKDRYYYSTKNMSNNYAMIAALVIEKDNPVTIASMTRFNCKTYPMPTPLVYFERHPYYLSKPEINRAVRILQTKEEFKDIHLIHNNENVPYLYSSDILSEKYARALIRVEEYTD